MKNEQMIEGVRSQGEEKKILRKKDVENMEKIMKDEER